MIGLMWAVLAFFLAIAAATVAWAVREWLRDRADERADRQAFTGTAGPPAPRHAAQPPALSHEEFPQAPVRRALPTPQGRPSPASPAPVPDNPAGAGHPLPGTVEAALGTLRATVAELAKPTDDQRWPHLVRAWEDDTGTFAKLTGVA